jgi:CheY-like chemotaxis protein
MNLFYFMDESSQNRVRTILVVDDNAGIRQLATILFNDCGYQVYACSNPAEALGCFNPTLHDLVMTDNSMPGMTGAEMTRRIKSLSPSTPVLMYTGNPPSDCPSVDVMIRKPVHLLVLKEEVEKLLRSKS